MGSFTSCSFCIFCGENMEHDILSTGEMVPTERKFDMAHKASQHVLLTLHENQTRIYLKCSNGEHCGIFSTHPESQLCVPFGRGRIAKHWQRRTGADKFWREPPSSLCHHHNKLCGSVAGRGERSLECGTFCDTIIGASRHSND